MDTIIRQSVGLDISMDDFHACFSTRDISGRIKRKGKVRKFSNTPTGFKELVLWIEKLRQDSSLEVTIVMEATGVYHEQVAYLSYEHAYRVAVLLPNTVKAFARSLNQLSKTDIVDSRLIAHLGAERQLRSWSPMSPVMQKLKGLNRQRQAFIKQQTVLGNQLHAEEKRARPVKSNIKRSKKMIRFYDKEITAIEKEIEQLVRRDAALKENVDRLCTIPGVAWKTATMFLAETDGLVLFKSQSQLISFCGYDIKHKDSGSSVHGQAKISKAGNSHIRGGLYMPSLTAKKYGAEFARAYERVYDRTGKGKMALMAVQRKMLNVMFACHKKKEDYNPEYALQRG